MHKPFIKVTKTVNQLKIRTLTMASEIGYEEKKELGLLVYFGECEPIESKSILSADV